MKQILLIGSSIIQQFRNCTIQNYHVINKGVSGVVTANLHKIHLAREPYDYIFFYAGNNDLKKNVDKKEAVRNIERYLYEFTQNFTDTHIAVLSLLTSPMNHQLQLIDDVIYINRKMKELEGVSYIDINDELSNKRYYYDDIHPNEEGYRILNRILNNYVTGRRPELLESCRAIPSTILSFASDSWSGTPLRFVPSLNRNTTANRMIT
jgi:lysophospholipase L1-like esterase